MCAKNVVAEKEFESIKKLVFNNNISRKEIENFSNIDYPLFSFKYLRPNSIKDCKDSDYFYKFLMRLKGLSEIGWEGIRKSPKHQYGMEPLPVFKIKPDLNCLSEIITRDVKNLHVLRADSKKHPFVGLQVGKIFYVIFIEAEFGDIYDH